MKTEIKNINPELAKILLMDNVNNRPIKNNNVAYLANEMKTGNWLFDGQPIRFSIDGELLDGQHRLTAIIESNTTQKFMVVHGLDKDVFKVMDTGHKRGAYDVLSIEGIANASIIASTIKLIILHKSARKEAVSNHEVLDFYNAHTYLSKYAVESGPSYHSFNKILSKSNIMFWRFILNETGSGDSEEFINRLCTGNNLSHRDPILALRTRLISDKIGTLKLTKRHKSALIIKTWNFYVRNMKVTTLRWSQSSDNFPKIL